jgi:CheY-like chemotaxis protein
MATKAQSAKEVLVVEDDRTIRETLVMLLKLEGYKASGAANGQEALHYLSRTEPPDLILLDLMMPVMDGCQFRKVQQQDPKLASIPVVVVSSNAMVGEQATALAVEGYLQKPVEVNELLSMVQRHC